MQAGRPTATTTIMSTAKAIPADIKDAMNKGLYFPFSVLVMWSKGKHWNKKNKKASVNCDMDIKHFFITKGQGTPLILLHGNGEDSSYFKGQIDVFAGKYRVYAIDTRGHGKTPRGNMPFTIRQFSEDLMGFMEEQQMEKAHILGFSDGANIAMIFAMKYPERVDRLILNGANLDPDGIKRSTQLPIEIGYKIAMRFAKKKEYSGSVVKTKS